MDWMAALEPKLVWQHFSMLCRIPRPSKQEAMLVEQIEAWAKACGIAVQRDEIGNLILRKPASPGCESWPGVLLQAHLDMVCQKNNDSAHDFSRDPIQAVLGEDGWLRAPATTLGADNGIGVALIMAALESDDFRHGPLEALLTVDEEAGMGGARALAPGLLDARYMLNLDTEAWGEFFLGCAGGLDVDVERSCIAEAVPAGAQAFELTLGGLRGGHSGVDIHEDRGNALKLLVRSLQQLADVLDFRLASLQGGTARNALPREAVACFTVSEAKASELFAWVADKLDALRADLQGIDDGISLTLTSLPVGAVSYVMPLAEQGIWLDSLHAAPHGVRRMSRQVTGVVETSNNLGMVTLTPTGGRCNFMVRSLVDREAQYLGDEIASLFALSQSGVTQSGHYPGWAPKPDSPLLQRCLQIYRANYGCDAEVRVIHAGLECGIIGAQYPGLDIVSFGPSIRGAHAPGEAVEVASVGRCWDLLRAILAGLDS